MIIRQCIFRSHNDFGIFGISRGRDSFSSILFKTGHFTSTHTDTFFLEF